MQKYFLYKEEINGFQDVAETMKVVEREAAARIHFLKKRVSILLDYKNTLEAELNRVSKFKQDENHALLKEREFGEKALLVIAGDKGIVGGLYHNLMSEFLQRKENYQKIFVLGNKVKEYFDEEGIEAEEFLYSADNLSELKDIKEMSALFFAKFLSGGLKSIDILYPSFVSILEQHPKFINFLPFDIQTTRGNKINNNDSIAMSGDGLPIFEPNKKRIFEILLKKYIDIFFAEIILEAKLSEFSARTVIAEHGVSKINEIVKSLELIFLKERRSLITQRQLESFVAHKIL